MTRPSPKPRTARCNNQIEHADLSASRCLGLLVFNPDDVQARCDSCRAFCGAGVADYISDLQAAVLGVLRDRPHKLVIFKDLDDVPLGSSGYLTSYGRTSVGVSRHTSGWLMDHGQRFTLEPGVKYTFTSHSGPANDAKLTRLIEEALVPERHMLVSFEAVTESESDWESGIDASWTELGNPTILAHNMDESDLAGLYYQVESEGSTHNFEAFDDLDQQIEALGQEPARRAREKRQADPLGLSQSIFDRKPEID